MIDNFDEIFPANKVDEAANKLISIIKDQASSELKEELEHLKQEAFKYKEYWELAAEKNREYGKQIAEIEAQKESNDIAEMIIAGCKNLDEARFDNLLSAIYEPTFPQLDLQHRYPAWVYFICKYYDHKAEVIKMLKQFNFIKYPTDIDKFRLPVDFTEEELDYFIEHMYHNVVCNNDYYRWNNLEWWYNKGTWSIQDMYSRSDCGYSEIPYQYIFLNPKMYTAERLAKIAKRIVRNHDTHLIKGVVEWMKPDTNGLTHFINNIIREMEDEMGEAGSKYKVDSSILEFLYHYMDLIYVSWVFDEIYEKYVHEYTHIDVMLKFPAKYFIKWVEQYPKSVGTILASDKIAPKVKLDIMNAIATNLSNSIGDETNE